jgi:glycosyltransferase involved in cell wall biosynthesis
MDKLLILASWYPSRVDFLNGDFVERHAKAIALKYDVTVIFISKDHELKDKFYDFEFEQTDNVKTYKGFYKEFNSKFSFVRKIVSQYRYFKTLNQLYKNYVSNEGEPRFVHLYIPVKAGIYALYLKFFKQIKYVVSEQHSYYMPESGGYDKISLFEKWMIKRIFQKAGAVHTVSNSLGKVLQQNKIITGNFTVIPNVVNVEIFQPKEEINHPAKTKFLTITGNVFHKNTDGIIRALKIVSQKRNDFTLEVIGPYQNALTELARDSGISKSINFHGAVPYEKVAEIMKNCDAMIFFTRYETFGCVIIEANACGLPVIASDLPVTRENITEGLNGIFVISENEEQLAEKLCWYMDHKNHFSKNEIAKLTAEKYNYQKISDLFEDFYKHL